MSTAPTAEKPCQHCGRTSSNGVRCKGKCVGDSDYCTPPLSAPGGRGC